MIRCASCGNNNPDDNNFCDQCGSKLNVINTGNSSNRQYINNPFADADSSLHQPQSQPRTNTCIMCHGEGRVQEPRPGSNGKIMITKTCPLCQGKRVLAGKSTSQKNYNNPFESTEKTTPNSNLDSNESSNNSNQYTKTNKMGIKETNRLAIGIIAGLIILFYIYVFVSRVDISSISDNTKSNKPITTPVETTQSQPYQTLSDSDKTTISYHDLFIVIPGNWSELSTTGDIDFRYGDKGDDTIALSGYYVMYENDMDFEQNKELLISEYTEELNNGIYDTVGYVECSVSGHDALKIRIDDQSVKRVELYVDNGDGMIHLRFRMSNSFKTNGELINSIIDSLYFNGSTPAESTESAKEIEYVSSTFNGLTFEYPITWYTVYTGDIDSDEIYYSDPNDYQSLNFIYLGYYTGSFDDEVKNDWISYYNENDYDISYSDSGVGNQFAWYCTWVDEYDTKNIEYVIIVDNGYIDLIFSYSLDQEEEILPVYEYIIDSITVEGAGSTGETEPTATSINTVESEQTVEPTEETTTETIELEPLFPDADVGDTVVFGSYKQDSSAGKDPIEWIVLENNENGMLLLSKYVLDNKVYYNDGNGINVDDKSSWSGSNLRYWLNNTFYNNSFTTEEKARIISDNDKVFLLSVEEVETYFGHGKDTEWGFDTNSSFASCQATDYAEFMGINVWDDGNVWWCLRTPGIDDEGNEDTSLVAVVQNDGFVDTSGSQVWGDYGVRPAIWIIP